MIIYLPLVAAIGLCLLLVVARASPHLDLILTRLGTVIFGTYVTDRSTKRRVQLDLMHAAHVDRTHRAYASRTLLEAGILGGAGGILGVYAIGFLLLLLAIEGDTIAGLLPEPLTVLAGLAQLDTLTLSELFLLLLGSSATVGFALAAGYYTVRWELLRQRAVARASSIDATLPRTVAFMYALSRSGTAFPRVMETLAKNERVYGEAATELGVAVRDMQAFGTDSLTALQRTARRTPSEDLAEFTENLASVLGSGQSISAFLEDQYRRYQDEAEAKQQQYLELLSTFAEAYVTALVAGPLFFITILVVIGLVLEDTLPLLRAVVYLGIPLATVAFVVYVDSVTQGLGGTDGLDEHLDPEPVTREPIPDGGAVPAHWTASRERLAAHDRLAGIRSAIEAPVKTMLAAPWTIAAVVSPIVLVWGILVVYPIESASLMRTVAQVDTPIVIGLVVVLTAYSVVYEIGKRRTRRIERSVPDFLDRFASSNEAGTSVVESLHRVTDSDLDALTPELERTWRDVQWGSDVATAMHRLEARVRSSLLLRTVTLVTNAMQASGDLGPVLRIAADEARATQRLRRERRQVMLTYLVVIYISFFVFLGIIAALSMAFIPAIEDAALASTADGATGGIGGITGGLGEINVFAYEQLFFHAAVIQAICSGLVAGQLGEGSVRDGVKHVVVLVAIALGTVALIGIV